MKKGINIGVVGQVGFEDGLKMIKDAGFESVELVLSDSGPVSPESSESDVKQVKEKVLKTGLELSSFLPGQFWKYPLTSSDAETRQKGEALLAKSLQICNWLGTDALLVVPGVVQANWSTNEVVSYEVAYERSQESIRKAIPVAEENNVCICVENVWNKFLLSPLEMKKFIEELNSDFVGAYFDVGNVLINGFPEQWIRILGKLVKRIHLKDFKTSVGNIGGFCNLLEGDVNWPEVIKALQEIGYDGYLTAEVGGYAYYSEAKLAHTSLSMDKIMLRS